MVGAARPEAGEPPLPSRRCSAGPSRGRRSAQRSALPDERPSLHVGVAHAAAEPRARLDLRLLAGRGPPPDARAASRAPTELAEQTTGRVLERLAGLGAERRVPRSTELDFAVFNPSPFPRTDVVRIPLDGFPVFFMSDITQDIHPLTLAAASRRGLHGRRRAGARRPVRRSAVGSACSSRCPPLDVELVVADVPAFGYRRIHLDARGRRSPGRARRRTRDRGRFGVGARRRRRHAPGAASATASLDGLGGLEHVADRGDTYDFDPVPDDPGDRVDSVDVRRRRHPSGIERLAVTAYRWPRAPVVRVEAAGRARRRARRPPRRRRASRTRPPPAAVLPDRRARRLLPRRDDVRHRGTDPPTPVDDANWVHPAPRTFPHQGWVEANGLTSPRPGFPRPR